jgi:hypothetical protein
LPNDTYADFVTMQDTAHFCWRQEDEALAVVTRNEAVPVPVSLHPALDVAQKIGGGGGPSRRRV